MPINYYHFFSKRLFVLACLSLILWTMSQLLGRNVWQLELFSHYTPHTAIMLLLATICYPNERAKITRGIFGIVGMTLMIWSFLPISSYYSYTSSDIDGNKAVTIFYQNVSQNHDQPEQLLSQLYSQQPDIVLLVEAGGKTWDNALEKLKKNYPIHCGVSLDNPFAIRAFIADKNIRCELFSISNYPTLKITQSDGRLIYGVHPPPPINAELAQERLQFLQQLKPMLKNTSNTLLVGDMNLSAFSPLYRDFIDATTINRTTANGLPTWLPFGISIDQILITAVQEAVDVTPLAWQGSDHRGFLIKWQ